MKDFHRLVNITATGERHEYTVIAEPDPAGERHIVLLIHGYNTPPATASRNFADLLWRTSSAWSHPDGAGHVTYFVAWPGYAPTFFTGQKPSRLGFATYAARIGVAIDSGRALAEKLASYRTQNASPLEVTVVAHSLGCRLTVEMVQQLDAMGANVRVRMLFLMAAAVPTGLLEGDEAHRVSLWRVDRRWAMHSVDDEVLETAFPAGQSLKFSEWKYGREAVGRFGNPDDGTWTHNRTTINEHSSYFYDPRTMMALGEAFGWSYKRLMQNREHKKRRLQVVELPPRERESRDMETRRRMA